MGQWRPMLASDFKNLTEYQDTVGYALDELRVLIVDRNVHIRDLLRTILQSIGIETIDFSRDAVAGFDAFCRVGYDVALDEELNVFVRDLQSVQRLARVAHCLPVRPGAHDYAYFVCHLFSAAQIFK